MQSILLKKSSISSRLLNCILGGILQCSAKLSAMGCTPPPLNRILGEGLMQPILLKKSNFKEGFTTLAAILGDGLYYLYRPLLRIK
jgi:hypothetical protein